MDLESHAEGVARARLVSYVSIPDRRALACEAWHLFWRVRDGQIANERYTR